MTALLHGVGQEGVKHEEWEAITERGAFALTRCCRKWDVANPHRFSNSVTAKERDEDEIAEKNETVEPEMIFWSSCNSFNS